MSRRLSGGLELSVCDGTNQGRLHLCKRQSSRWPPSSDAGISFRRRSLGFYVGHWLPRQFGYCATRPLRTVAVYVVSQSSYFWQAPHIHSYHVRKHTLFETPNPIIPQLRHDSGSDPQFLGMKKAQSLVGQDSVLTCGQA